MVLLVNQHSVPVFVDVVNAFADAGQETRLFTGYTEVGRVPLAQGVRTTKSFGYNRTSTVLRLTSWMLFSVHYFFYLLFCKKPSCILVVTNPPLTSFVTALLSGIRNVPFYVVVFDLYPEAAQIAGKLREDTRVYRAWQRINRWAFAKAKGLITLSASMKLAATKYCDPQKISIIFNWADGEYLKPIDKAANSFISTLGLEGKFVVMYSGNMGATHDLESLVNAAAILRSDTQVRFVLIGDGEKRRALEAIAINKNLDNITFLKFQEPDVFRLAMAAADVGIVTLGTGAEGISVPSKTYSNMAAGAAIIAISPPNSELNRIVEEYSVGYIVAPGQPEKLAAYIRDLASNPELLNRFKSNSRSASMSYTSANAREYVRLVLGT